MTYRNADTRIREAFAALRAEIEGVFGEGVFGYDQFGPDDIDRLEQDLLDYAKQPASEG
jgi:hypothetical protein